MIPQANEQLLLPAHARVRGWLIPFASRIVVIAPQQNCGRYTDHDLLADAF